MRLDFNVLWVEDQPANVADQQERINHQIRKEGFRLQVQFAGSVDDAKAYLADDVYGDHIDLILMDYDLGAGKTGRMASVKYAMYSHTRISFFIQRTPLHN